MVPLAPPPADPTLRQPIAPEFYYFSPSGQCLTYAANRWATPSDFPSVATFPLTDIDILIADVKLDPESRIPSTTLATVAQLLEHWPTDRGTPPTLPPQAPGTPTPPRTRGSIPPNPPAPPAARRRNPPRRAALPKDTPCLYFQQARCHRGESCPFSHAAPAVLSKRSHDEPPPPEPKASKRRRPPKRNKQGHSGPAPPNAEEPAYDASV